jgi:hypothetical protein
MIRNIKIGLKVRYTEDVRNRIKPEFADHIGTITGTERWGGRLNARVTWEKPVIGNVGRGTARYVTVESKHDLERA